MDQHEWINRRIGQLGIDVREQGHAAMLRYIYELEVELKYTVEFLMEDGLNPSQKFTPPSPPSPPSTR